MPTPTGGRSGRQASPLFPSGLSRRIYDASLPRAFVTAKPPPPEVAFQELLMAADPPGDYFS